MIGNKLLVQHSYKELLVGGILMLLAVAPLLTTNPGATLLISSLSLIVFTFWLGNAAWKEPFFAVCCMPVLFNYLWFVVSFVLFEYGAYTPELRMTGTVTGGTARLGFFLYLFVFCARLAFRSIKMPTLDLGKFDKRLKIAMPLTLCMLLSVLAIYVVYGTAISNSVDRIQYRSNVAPKFYSQIITVLVFLSFFVGLVRRRRQELGRGTRFVDATFVLSLIVLALGGEKFSLLFTSISLYIAPQFYGRKLEVTGGKFIRYMFVGLIGVGAVVGLVVNQYMGIVGGGVWDIIAQLLLDRISQQAQLNFYFDNLAFVQHITHGDIFDFIANEILGVASSDYRGIQLLMNAASPADLFAIYSEAGVTFGDGFPGILFYYFGWSSIVLIVLCGFVYGLLTRLCVKFSMEGRIVTGLVLFYIFYNICLSAFMNGELHLLLEVTLSKAIAIGILLMITAVRLPLFVIHRAETSAAKC